MNWCLQPQKLGFQPHARDTVITPVLGTSQDGKFNGIHLARGPKRGQRRKYETFNPDDGKTSLGFKPKDCEFETRLVR